MKHLAKNLAITATLCSFTFAYAEDAVQADAEKVQEVKTEVQKTPGENKQVQEVATSVKEEKSEVQPDKTETKESVSETNEATQTAQAEVTEQEVAAAEVEKVTFEIVVSQEKGEIIEEIITTMGTSSVIGLGFKKNHLKELGKKINDIGSLQFLGYIFSRPDLKKHMANIRKSSMKWNGFMDGVKPGLSKIEANNELYATLPAFCEKLKVKTDPLKKKAQEKDWNGFVAYLIQS